MDALVTLGGGDMRRTLNILQVITSTHHTRLATLVITYTLDNPPLMCALPDVAAPGSRSKMPVAHR
jgi:hypothetical protein